MKTYEALMKKSLDLIAKHRYTVLRLKEKLITFYDKQVEKGKLPMLSIQEKEKEIKKVLQRLKELKYLDDTQFAKDYIENRVEFRPRGKYLLKRELRKKGLHPDLADRVTEETDIDETEIAFKALSKKMKHLSKDPYHKQKEKALRFLASRGFNIESIYKAIERWYNTDAIR